MIQTTQADWAAHWRAVQEARTAQQARTRRREGDFWGGRAGVFAGRIGVPDAALDLLLERIEPGDTVLDVGAGAGRYAIPAAARARQVIAVEPSQGMGRALLDEAAKRGIQNIEWIEGDWLTAQAPHAEIVFCAHVLYFTPDVAPFVQKLDEHAERECMILIRVDQAGAGFAPLYEEFRGEPQAPEPSFIDLYNLLYHLGIVADVRVVEGINSMSRFQSIDQAEATAATMLEPSDDQQHRRIRAFLEANLVQGRDGAWTFAGGSPRVAVVSWRKGSA